MENVFDELKRYVRWDERDEHMLRLFAPLARPHFTRVADGFYERLNEHDGARAVLTGAEQGKRLRRTLTEWMEILLVGPWDATYFERRWRIGQVHVRIGLQQRYMFGAMHYLRHELTRIAQHTYLEQDEQRRVTVRALDKMLDIELAIMLESYREAFVEKVQHIERMERDTLERLLAISEERYDEIVEAGEALVTTFDRKGSIVFFNRRAEQLTGLSRSAALGQSWPQLFMGNSATEEIEDIYETVATGTSNITYEGCTIAADGNERWVRWHFTTLPGAGGGVLCALGLDVTEERALADRTRHAEQLAALGTMAAGLAHEIRNPLNAAHLQLTLMQRRLQKRDLDRASLLASAGLVASEMKRLAELVQQFLQFAKPQKLQPMHVDLRATAEAIVSLLAPEAEAAGAALQLPAGAPVPAQVDDERIKQVLLNLVRNALEATTEVKGGGRVEVRVGADGEEAVLEVEDNGPGLPQKEAPIFEPFFTTKANGTGLGLPIVHRIVTEHGGDVLVESSPGRTVFTVRLPTRHSNESTQELRLETAS